MKLKINNTTWTVFTKSIDSFGLTIYKNLFIVFDKAMIEEKSQRANLRPTIIHELVHAYLYSYGMYTAEDNATLTEEQLCEFVAMNAETILKLTDKVEKELLKEDK